MSPFFPLYIMSLPSYNTINVYDLIVIIENEMISKFSNLNNDDIFRSDISFGNAVKITVIARERINQRYVMRQRCVR